MVARQLLPAAYIFWGSRGSTSWQHRREGDLRALCDHEISGGSHTPIHTGTSHSLSALPDLQPGLTSWLPELRQLLFHFSKQQCISIYTVWLLCIVRICLLLAVPKADLTLSSWKSQKNLAWLPLAGLCGCHIMLLDFECIDSSAGMHRHMECCFPSV